MCGIGARKYRVEPREIKARLDSPVVAAVVEMGYSRNLVREAIQVKLSTTGTASLRNFWINHHVALVQYIYIPSVSSTSFVVFSAMGWNF